jgi:PPOX class probable F420-dependent enzyme
VDARALVTQARVARLATVDEGGRPHLVPVCFAVEGDRIYSAVDGKPKRSPDLKRLRNIAAHPQVALLVDHYEEDWTRVWWVRVDGPARVLDSGPERDAGIDLLSAKYDQYRDRPDQLGRVVVITAERWRAWSAAGS